MINLTKRERARINTEIKNYRETHEPIRLFMEILNIDTSERLDTRENLEALVLKISRLEDEVS
jgi:hypothetical protein